MDENKANIVLIGMPGVGKSTVGVLVAKELSREFIDTDLYIQAAEGRRLQQIIDEEGMRAFCRKEELYVRSLDLRGHVVATGGSVVYSDRAMRKLAADGVIVHMHLPLTELEQRLSNLPTRGVVMAPGETLAELHGERTPLYRRWADATVDCTGLTHEEATAGIVRAVKNAEP